MYRMYSDTFTSVVYGLFLSLQVYLGLKQQSLASIKPCVYAGMQRSFSANR